MRKVIETMAPEKAAEYLRSYGLRISKETIWAGLQQGKFTTDMTKAMKKGGDAWDIIQLEASNQFSAALSSDGDSWQDATRTTDSSLPSRTEASATSSQRRSSRQRV